MSFSSTCTFIEVASVGGFVRKCPTILSADITMAIMPMVCLQNIQRKIHARQLGQYLLQSYIVRLFPPL